MVHQARIYQHEGNEQQVYLLLFRHATLVLRHLSTHPDARQPNHRLALRRANEDVQSSLAELEVLKPHLITRYQRYEQYLKDCDTGVTSKITRANKDTFHQVDPDSHQWLQSTVPTISSNSENSTFGDINDVAVTLAQDEIRRRASTRVGTSLSSASKRHEQDNRAAGGLGDLEDLTVNDEQRLHQQTRELRPSDGSLQMETAGPKQFNLEHSYLTDQNTNSTFYYPEVHQQGVAMSRQLDDQVESLQEGWPLKTSKVTQPPNRPPKAQAISASRNKVSSEFRHEHIWDLETTVGDVTSSTPLPQRRSPTFTFKYSASLENGALLRTVFLPPSLRISFLSLALPNTRANLETCGILCGTLISNALFISKLVIPDQESTSDTCETINEDKLFEYVDGEDLMVLGWIHTHPTQTCFMSSRDLHTHAGYQAMMPESIAIVCAPSKGEYVL